MRRRKQNRRCWNGFFRGRGYKWTASRQFIIKILQNEKGHLSAEEIYRKVKPLYPSIGIATIYRNLEIFEKMGVLSKLDFGDNRSRYELAEDFSLKGHHHHLVCKNCNKIIEYDDYVEDEINLINKVQNALHKKYGFNIEDHYIQFYGLCSDCSK